MKYHMNPETGKVSACRAKVKCRFGGASGSENHFNSKEAAEKASEELMSSKHGFTSVRKSAESKPVGKSKFELTKSNIRAGLVKTGISASALPDVSSEEELVEKWFGGDRAKYDLISRISEPKSHLTQKTKDSVSGFVKKGAAVGFVPDMEHLARAKKSGSESSVSEVDLIDDLPGGKIDLADLASGKLRAF